jgi:hypothetical protein
MSGPVLSMPFVSHRPPSFCQRPTGGPRPGLAYQLACLFPTGWHLLHDSAVRPETVLATDGRMSLRQSPVGIVACTMVKGPAETALQTGLRRLEAYAAGQNHAAMRIATARPVVQRPTSAERWLVEIGLPGFDDPIAAPVPRNCKVRIQLARAETLAVIRVPGLRRWQGFSQVEDEIQAVMAERGWAAAGPAMLRLHTPLAVFPLLGSVEITIPVRLARS